MPTKPNRTETSYLLRLLAFAQKNYPDGFRVLPMMQHVARIRRGEFEQLAGGYRRRGNGRVILVVPSEMVENMKGDESEVDLYLFLRVRRSTIERFESPVALVGETPT
ncbi:MAG TPA: hypothetical protein DCQ64_12570 [Candidatus Rokubacteria bacterium]|nr:hypothetical protein [Candidatus Rokubacteria bacterium]